MLHALRFAAFATAVVATAVHAQVWTQDPTFHPALANDTPALTSSAFIPTADGRVLVFGSFTHLKAGDVAARGLAILHGDGTPDSSFNAEVGATESITAAVPLKDGRVLAERRNADGSLSLVRFTADGHVDQTFTPIAAGYRISLTLQPDGRVLGWGSYITINGSAHGHLVRFNADGTLDDAFTPTGLGFEVVSSIAAQTDGKILVTGVAGSMGTRILIRLNADGTLDSAFTPQSKANTLNNVAVQSDSKILAIGFDSVERFNPDGSSDTSFAPNIDYTLFDRVTVRADGTIVIQGQADDRGTKWIPTVLIISADGKVVKDVRSVFGSNQAVELACVMPDNATWLVHGIPVFGYVPRPVTLTPGPGVPLSVVTAPSTVARTIGTTDSSVAPLLPVISPGVVPGRAVLSRLASDNATVSAIDPGLLARTTGSIGMMKSDAANRITIQGQFTSVDGVARPGLARFTASGALDTTFSPTFGEATFSRFLLLAPDGQIYGTTTTLSNQATDGVYTTVEQLVHLRADGSTDPDFAPAVGYGLDVGWLAAAPDGRVLVSFFTPDNNHEENLRLGWLDTSGKLVSTLPTQFAGLSILIVVGNGPIETTKGGSDSGSSSSGVSPSTSPGLYGNPFSFAQVQPNGKILLGGMFERVNGTPAPRLVRLNADGSVDPSYTPDRSGFIGEPNAWLDRKGRVVLSGQTPRNGKAVNVLYRLLDDGSRDPAYYSVTDFPPNTLFRLENGLPDLSFPTQVTNPDGTMSRIVSALMADDSTVWTMNPLARFTASDVATITVDPTDRTLASGNDTTFFVGLGTRDSARYQWLFNGAPISGATLPFLPLTAITAAQAGQYAVRVTVDGQTLTSAAGSLTVTGGAVRLVNFSARACVSADSSPIAGFVIAGDGAKRDWLLRAMGPTLTWFGVTNTLSDPELALFSGGAEIAHDTGSASKPEISQFADRVGAFPVYVRFIPPLWYSSKSALIRTLSPGAYTVSGTSVGGNSGTALLEVYDSIPGGASGSLRNVSLRTRTGGGNNTATLGFVLVGNSPAKVLIRGVGPTLGSFGVNSALPDPVLSVYNASSSALATNSGWANNADIAAAAHEAGTFALPDGSRDAALVLRLEPGAYTAQVTSASHSTAEAMVEVYLLSQ